MTFWTMSRFLALALTIMLIPTTESAAEDGKFVIAFRMVKPTTLEFDDAAKGKAHLDALKKIGVRATPENHNGHMDVTCQQSKWTELTVASDELVHQWQGWLNKAGFETLHADGAEEGHDHGHAHEGVELVKLQAKAWIVKHFDNESDAKEFAAIGKALGCEVKQDIHDGHADVQVRCQSIRHLECRSHEEAEVRVKWLREFGFDAKHDD